MIYINTLGGVVVSNVASQKGGSAGKAPTEFVCHFVLSWTEQNNINIQVMTGMHLPDYTFTSVFIL